VPSIFCQTRRERQERKTVSKTVLARAKAKSKTAVRKAARIKNCTLVEGPAPPSPWRPRNHPGVTPRSFPPNTSTSSTEDDLASSSAQRPSSWTGGSPRHVTKMVATTMTITVDDAECAYSTSTRRWAAAKTACAAPTTSKRDLLADLFTKRRVLYLYGKQ